MLKKNNISFIAISIFIILYVITTPFLTIDGGVLDDTLVYVKNLKDFPKLESSVFPMGYSSMIAVANIFVKDYFLSTKIVGLFAVVLILFFSYYKNFFFRETVLYLGFNTYTIFCISLSESVYLMIQYFIFYFFYKILEEKKYSLFNIFSVSLLITFLFFTRYSTLFLFCGVVLFTAFKIFKNGIKDERSKVLLKIIAFSGLGISIYLAFNYIYTDSFLGGDFRTKSLYQGKNLIGFIISQIVFPTINGTNPFIETFRINKFWFIISIISSVISFTCIIIFTIIIFFKKRFVDFYQLCLILVTVYYLGLVYSLFDTYIEALHLRLISPILQIVFLIILINLKDFKGIKLTNLLLIPLASLLLNVYKISTSYFPLLTKKKNIELFLKINPQKKFYYNDINKIPTETGGLLTSNYYTIYLINPSIRKLQEIELKNHKQKEIILESELVNIEPINQTFYKNPYQIRK